MDTGGDHHAIAVQRALAGLDADHTSLVDHQRVRRDTLADGGTMAHCCRCIGCKARVRVRMSVAGAKGCSKHRVANRRCHCADSLQVRQEFKVEAQGLLVCNQRTDGGDLVIATRKAQVAALPVAGRLA